MRDSSHVSRATGRADPTAVRTRIRQRSSRSRRRRHRSRERSPFFERRHDFPV